MAAAAAAGAGLSKDSSITFGKESFLFAGTIANGLSGFVFGNAFVFIEVHFDTSALGIELDFDTDALG